LVWELAEPAIALVDGSGHGDWWNARLAAARAIGTGDPFQVNAPGPWDSLIDRIRLVPADLRVGDANVTLRTTGDEERVQASRSTVLGSPDVIADVHSKSRHILGINPRDTEELTAMVLAPAPDWLRIRDRLLR